VDSPTPAIPAADFKYDPATDQYQYSWQTQTSWAGTCRAFILTLKDGSSHIAHFQFDAVAKPNVAFSVSPNTAIAGVTSTYTFALEIASPVPITSIAGPCVFPLLQPNTFTYKGSCNSTTKFSVAGKPTVTATVGFLGRPSISSTVTITVASPPAPTVELRAGPAIMSTGIYMGITMELTISSMTSIVNIDSSKLVDNQLSGGEGQRCVFPQAAEGQTSYRGTCNFTVGPYSKSGKMTFSVPVSVEGRTGTTVSNSVTITVVK
jgi:hypothetical protein